jgi:hypothetical protein
MESQKLPYIHTYILFVIKYPPKALLFSTVLLTFHLLSYLNKLPLLIYRIPASLNMKKSWTSTFGFIIPMFAAVAWAGPVPNTGQTKCYGRRQCDYLVFARSVSLQIGCHLRHLPAILYQIIPNFLHHRDILRTGIILRF